MKKSLQKSIKGFNIIFLGIFMSLFLLVTKASAQKCKPDHSKLDKIEKKQVDAWTAELYESSFGSRMTNSSAVYITFSIARIDTANFVQLQLSKAESSVRNQLFESSLKGAKGNEFFFGIKDGEPLKFVADEATNQTKAGSLSGTMITTVELASYIKSENLQAVKDALTNKVIDATRIKLENGVVIDQSVKEKKGEKMKEKAVCFFSFLQDKGYMK